MSGSDPGWVRRQELVLRAEQSRVVTTIFLPGQDKAFAGESRSSAVLERILALPEVDVQQTLSDIMTGFEGRHRDLQGTWAGHGELLEHRLVGAGPLSPARRQLIGAYFTQEYAIESAALCNPSMVEHPDQTGVPPGAIRFLMTARGIGEGHISSLEFRTGLVDARDALELDPQPQLATLPTALPTEYSRSEFAAQLRDIGGDRSNSDFVLDLLPDNFTRQELEGALSELRLQRLTRGAAPRTIERFERMAANTYAVEFPTESTVQERVLMPRGPAESHGLEDARMVRFQASGGSTSYVGTYTAYDGRNVTSQLISTPNFRTFTVDQLSGPGAKNKGLALFPRQVGGRYLAVSRADRESNALSFSSDLRHWERPELLQAPRQAWEIVQLGNCGPPIETDAGWLVLTHGVGPMRTYGIGALLLDLSDPSLILGQLRRPFLTPAADERSGYVPNVVYSCGGLLHGRTLVLPYGCSDSAIRFAMVSLDHLLGELLEPAA